MYLQIIIKNGVFIIRNSVRDPVQPYSLSVCLSSEVHHIKIRKSENGFTVGEACPKVKAHG